MKHLFYLLTFIAITFTSFGQNVGKISGTIKDGGNQKIIDAATISLLRSNDSGLAKVGITDKEGNFIFENVKPGNYMVQASSLGHSIVYSKTVSVSAAQNSAEVGVLQLIALDKSLKEVTVTSKKMLIERKIDRTVINVEAAISNEGSTALEVLEKSPGVTVDKDGNISLKGKAGVMIMLDGKPSYLNGQELANLLRSMPSNNLDQIEIMTNPSAKYDAAGNSGIINIKTKKNKQKGFNGSVNLAYGQGVYEKTNNSLNLNYRNGKFNVFGNIGANYRETFNILTIRRRYKNEDKSLNAIFEQTSNEMRFNNNYNAKVGADFYATKKTTFGIVLTGFTTPSNQVAKNISYLKSNTGTVDSIVTAASAEKSSWKNGAVNLNFRHQFDSTGREITADIDYLTYDAHKDQNFTNTSYTPDWIIKNSDKLMGELPSLINIYSGKIDYTHPLKSGLKIETGLKTSFVETDNTAGYYNIIGNAKVVDYDKTNQFVYKENINAAYLNMNKQIKKWGLQAGLRVENTNYNGRQFGNPQRQDSAFKKSYTGVFPTMFVSYNANEKNQFGVSYGRRINRPDYEDLNPFLFFIDKYTYGSGNPFLKPSYAHAFELSHTYNQFLTTTINYSNTKDLFNETFEQKGYATIVKQGNFGSANNASISVSAQIPVEKWWTSIIYSEYNYRNYKGLLNGDNINVKAGNFLVNINNQFKFKKGWSAELSGFYRTSGIEGQIIIRPMGQLNAGVQKQVLKNKGTLKLNVRDMLYTMTATGDINFQRTEAYFHNERDSRVVTLSFGYRFGKPIKGTEKRKTGGADTEQNRVKGGN
ncbi:MAG: TonB-dependent receptor [Ferruginibacter sp.]|nr:TonB-dependent receptor [Ferruginibacter sp.]